MELNIRKDTPYTKLVTRIYEKGYTLKGARKNIAKPLGITSACFYERIGRKHRGTRSFRDTEILKLCEILRIPKREIYDYFMKPLLEKHRFLENDLKAKREEKTIKLSKLSKMPLVDIEKLLNEYSKEETNDTI